MLKLVDADKPAPPGMVVIRLTSTRAVWFALAASAALIALALTPSTSVESFASTSDESYRIEWTCPTFGESRLQVTPTGAIVPARKLLTDPCADEAGQRRAFVLVGLPWALLIAGLSLVGRVRARRSQPAAAAPDQADDPRATTPDAGPER